MFRAVVFAVLTLFLCQLGDGTVPMQSADGAADVPAMEALLADAGSQASATDPVPESGEDFFQDDPAALDVEPFLEEALAEDDGQETGETLFAGNLIPADDPLMAFDAEPTGAFPVFAGVHREGEQDIGPGPSGFSVWPGMGSGFLAQAAGMKTPASEENGGETGTDTGNETNPDTGTEAGAGSPLPDETGQPGESQPVSVPEPGTAPLLALGLMALLFVTRRKVFARC